MHKILSNIDTIIAGDKTILKEVLHPKNDPIDLPYSLAHAMVPPGKASLPHILDGIEVYYILSGIGIMHLNDKTYSVRKEETIVVPAGAEQWIENTGTADLVFLVIVSPPWSDDGEEIL